MRRDMDLVRKILMLAEESEEVLHDPEIEGHTDREVAEHARLLTEAGLLRANWTGDTYREPMKLSMVFGLTWEGHEFLASARNEGVWQEATSVAKTKGLELPFSLLQVLMESIIRATILPGGS